MKIENDRPTKHMKALNGRLRYLREKVERCSPNSRQFLLGEILALEWALRVLEPFVRMPDKDLGAS